MGRRIRQRRREKGFSQTELAVHLGLTLQQVQRYEKGMNRISVSRLQQIAEMLSADISLFYDGDGSDVDSPLLLNSVYRLQLLRSYTAIKDRAVKRRFIIFVEMIAASQR
jgi:transcriptional regulator with XRE-family HTH domain